MQTSQASQSSHLNGIDIERGAGRAKERGQKGEEGNLVFASQYSHYIDVQLCMPNSYFSLSRRVFPLLGSLRQFQSKSPPPLLSLCKLMALVGLDGHWRKEVPLALYLLNIINYHLVLILKLSPFPSSLYIRICISIDLPLRIFTKILSDYCLQVTQTEF